MVQCIGFTKTGDRCSRKSISTQNFCWQHKRICDEKENLIKIESMTQLSNKPLNQLTTRVNNLKNTHLIQALEPNILVLINSYIIIPEGVAKIFTLQSDKKWLLLNNKFRSYQNYNTLSIPNENYINKLYVYFIGKDKDITNLQNMK